MKAAPGGVFLCRALPATMGTGRPLWHRCARGRRHRVNVLHQHWVLLQLQQRQQSCLCTPAAHCRTLVTPYNRLSAQSTSSHMQGQHCHGHEACCCISSDCKGDKKELYRVAQLRRGNRRAVVIQQVWVQDGVDAAGLVAKEELHIAAVSATSPTRARCDTRGKFLLDALQMCHNCSGAPLRTCCASPSAVPG